MKFLWNWLLPAKAAPIAASIFLSFIGLSVKIWLWYRNKTACTKSNPVQSSRSESTTCPRTTFALVGNSFLPIPSKFHFTWKIKWLVAARNLQRFKTFWTLELSQYHKSGSMFSSSESLLLPAATASDYETPCVCACLSDQHKQSWRAAPRAWPLILPSKPSNLQLPSGTAFREIASWPAGAQTWTQTWTLPPDQRVVKVL